LGTARPNNWIRASAKQGERKARIGIQDTSTFCRTAEPTRAGQVHPHLRGGYLGYDSLVLCGMKYGHKSYGMHQGITITIYERSLNHGNRIRCQEIRQA
jgi:hypothetical protein